MILKIGVYKESTSQQHVIAGRIFELGLPVSRLVYVYSRNPGRLLARTRSDPNGRYKLYVPHDMAYTIISKDPNRKFNAVIQDNVVPK